MAVDIMVGEAMYRRLIACKSEFGMRRLELGMLLEIFRANPSMWEGRAQSFSAFLEGEHINSNGAYQWMRIARKLLLELRLPDETLRALASVSFSLLDIACRMIDHQNLDEVVSIVCTLNDRDARVALDEIRQDKDYPADGNDTKTKMPNEVRSLLSRFQRMPDDFRIEFLRTVRGQNSEHTRNRPRSPA